MAKAYDVMYLEDASDNLGFMLGYSQSFGLGPVEVWKKFIVSKVASNTNYTKLHSFVPCFAAYHFLLPFF